jgi:hypothetical protein
MVETRREHEQTDVDIRAIAAMAAGLLGIVALIVVGTNLVTRWVAARPNPSAPKASPLYRPAPPPEPRLQVVPPEDLKAFRAREDKFLTSYTWVDPPAGIVRIPIDVAKKEILERGLPTRPAAPK